MTVRAPHRVETEIKVFTWFRGDMIDDTVTLSAAWTILTAKYEGLTLTVVASRRKRLPGGTE